MILKHNRNWSSLLWSSWLCFWLGTWEWSRIGSPCTWVPFPYDLCLCEENFEEIQQLISQIKRKEIIATTAEPQTTTSVQGLIHKETDRRKSIHEDRLTQYLEMAKRSGIPRQSSDHLDWDTWGPCRITCIETRGAFYNKVMCCRKQQQSCTSEPKKSTETPEATVLRKETPLLIVDSSLSRICWWLFV